MYNCSLIDNIFYRPNADVRDLWRTFKRLKLLGETLQVFNVSCGVGGMAQMRAQVCWHLLSRPDNTGSGSRISRRQTAQCASAGFRFRVLGARPAVGSPLLMLVCLASRKGDGRANTHSTTTGHHPPSVTGTTQARRCLKYFRRAQKVPWSLEKKISIQYCVPLRVMRKCVTILIIRHYHACNVFG